MVSAYCPPALDTLCDSKTHLSDTLSPLSPAQYSPGNATGILALEKERLGFPILEAEDLAVTADEELALLS